MGIPSAQGNISAHLGRLKDAVRLVWDATPGWTFVNLVLVLIQGVLPLLALFVMKQIVDMVSAGIKSGHAAAMIHPLICWVAIAGGVAVFTALCRSLTEMAGEAQAQLVTDSVADTLHAQSAAVDLSFYEDHRYLDTLHRAQQEAPYRPVSIINSLLQIGQSSISLLGIAGILISYNWVVGLVLLAVALPGALVRLGFARLSYGLQQQQTEAERRSHYFHYLLTDTIVAKEIRLFQLGDFFRMRYRDLRTLVRTAKLALSRRRMVLDLLTQMLASVAIFAALGFIALEALHGKITLGAMVMYYQGFQAGVAFFQALLRGLAGVYEHSLFLTNYQEFLALQPTLAAHAPVLPVPQDACEGVRFHGVTFHYPNNPHYAVEDIDLSIAPGQVIALVGGNGSGKTTLTKLLCRLYDPTAGFISFNGTDIRHFSCEAWRRRLSVVFQDYIHYFFSARENIRLGDVTREAETGEIEAAAQAAGADETIGRLPQGYDNLLGPSFIGGHDLSIGEWQKVAIARAFFRNAGIVVLDEPSSALDPQAEADLFRKFRMLIHGRSAVLVSHRFSTVQMADCIYVMDHGRIVERGTHQELLRENGLYAHLYQLQAEYYQEKAEAQTDS